MKQTPIESIASLKSAGWTESEIAAEVDANQTTINRIGRGVVTPLYDLGVKLVDLAEKVAADPGLIPSLRHAEAAPIQGGAAPGTA